MMEWMRQKEAAAAIEAAKMERQLGGDSLVPYVALHMFWYNKKKEDNYPPQGSNYPRDFWKREEINRIGNCSKISLVNFPRAGMQ